MKAVKVGAIVGLLLAPAIQLFHFDELMSLIRLYQSGEWGAVSGWIIGETIGGCIAYSFLAGLVCVVRNLFVVRRL
jgi:hypothetical protein